MTPELRARLHEALERLAAAAGEVSEVLGLLDGQGGQGEEFGGVARAAFELVEQVAASAGPLVSALTGIEQEN